MRWLLALLLVGCHHVTQPHAAVVVPDNSAVYFRYRCEHERAFAGRHRKHCSATPNQGR